MISPDALATATTSSRLILCWIRLPIAWYLPTMVTSQDSPPEPGGASGAPGARRICKPKFFSSSWLNSAASIAAERDAMLGNLAIRFTEDGSYMLRISGRTAQGQFADPFHCAGLPDQEPSHNDSTRPAVRSASFWHLPIRATLKNFRRTARNRLLFSTFR